MNPDSQRIDSTPGSPFTIERATWRDLNDLRNLEKICFPKDAWPLWDLVGVLTMPNVERLKAVVNGEMVGFVAADVRPSQDVAWIATIGVLPGYRRQGIATALMKVCEENLKVSRVRLSARRSNDAAIRLYQNEGYAKVGLWPGYYQDREDAVVMEKRL